MKNLLIFLGAIVVILTFLPSCAVRKDFCECVNLQKAITDEYMLSAKEKREKEEGCKWIQEELSPVEIIQKTAECWGSKTPNSHEDKEKRIADSIRLSDSLSAVYQNQKNTEQPQESKSNNSIISIGIEAYGGIVFYENNGHGLVAAPSDFEGDGDWERAKNICDDLVLNGYDDWYLPSINELHTLYTNLHLRGMGNFKNDWYWSSTLHYPQDESHYVRAEDFSNGHQGNMGAATPKIKVRAVRKF